MGDPLIEIRTGSAPRRSPRRTLGTRSGRKRMKRSARPRRRLHPRDSELTLGCCHPCLGRTAGARRGSARPRRGCREKPFEKTRSTLAEAHLRAAAHDALATDRLGAADEMAVFATRPYKRSSGLARGFPDSHDVRSAGVAAFPRATLHPVGRMVTGYAAPAQGPASAWAGERAERELQVLPLREWLTGGSRPLGRAPRRSACRAGGRSFAWRRAVPERARGRLDRYARAAFARSRSRCGRARDERPSSRLQRARP